MSRKYRGHYCHVCGRVRANEKFTGRGHRNHVCKDCARSGKRRHLAGEAVPHEPALFDPDSIADWSELGASVAAFQPRDRHGRRPLLGRTAEDLLLMLLYLSAATKEELDMPRCDRSVIDRLIGRLETAGMITQHQQCFLFTEEGANEAANLLTEYRLDDYEEEPW